MELSLFKNYLVASGSSEATIKNYLTDIKRFIRYFEAKYSISFSPELVTGKTINDYRSELTQEIGQRSVDRHLSSLRRFFLYCSQEGQIGINPFSQMSKPDLNSLDSLAKLKSFKDHLYRSQASDLTIKNYIIDVRQFLFWLSLSSTASGEPTELSAKEVIARISPDALATYKDRLVHQSDLSISSINRKLSSLRTYLRWASLNGIVAGSLLTNGIEVNQFASVSNVKEADPMAQLQALNEADEDEPETISSNYSSFPPIRLLQKCMLAATLGLDFLLITPLAYGISSCQFMLWKISGEKLFEAAATTTVAGHTVTRDSLSNINNLNKNYFTSPLLSPMETAIHKRFAYYIVHVRPLWYRKYQSYKVVRVLHTGIMMTVVAVAVLFVYDHTLATQQGAILGQNVQSSGRTLSFKGALADEKGNPITEPTSLRFTIYTSRTGSQNKLWQETREITPDGKGGFMVALGEATEIPDYVFAQGKRLFVGVSVNNEGELVPRQAVPNVALSEDSQMLQGLLPVTDPNAGSQNVILALDSSGNLTLGGEKSHVFQATGGSFQIKGQSVVLSTIAGSDGSIVLNPDGQGVVDLQKPLQNTSEEIIGNGPAGAVLVNDLFAISATGSGQAALTITQNGTGPLISASASGLTRFSVDNIGSTTIGHNLTIGGTDIASTRSVFNLLNRNVAIVNFAGESEAVTIGSSSGTTTIRNARTTISGDLTISGVNGATFMGDNAGITFSGTGSHTIMATGGNLRLNSNLALGDNISITPQSINGTNNLGSDTVPFDNVYAQSFVLPSKAIITSQGSFGLGTMAPSYLLHVQGSNPTDAVAMLENTNTNFDADVLKLKIGSLTPSTSNKFINFLDGSNNSMGSIQASGSGGVSYLTTGSDFAEYFRKEDPGEPMMAGDLVCLGTTGGITLCDTKYNKIVGVITDRAGFVGASDKANNSNYALVGLHGQVMVRIKATDRVMPGDSLSISSMRGIAKRADSSGQIIGRALESSDGGTSVLTYILPSWHDPTVSLKDNGNLTIIPVEADEENTSSFIVVDTISNKAVGSFGVFSDVVAGTVKSGVVNTRDIIVDNSVRVGGTVFASALSAGEISAKSVRATENLFAKAVEAESISSNRIIAPIVEAEKIKVSILSPVSDDALTVHLQNKRVEFISSETPDQPVAVIDDRGNASFSGNLSSQNAKVEDKLEAQEVATQRLSAADATVSGTLVVKELIAEKLNLSDSAMDQLMAKLTSEMESNLATLLSHGVGTDEIADLLNPLLPTEENEVISPLYAETLTSTPSASSMLSSNIINDFTDISSMSAIALNNLTTDEISVNNSLMVFGVTSLAQAAVADMLSVGGSMTIQNNSINTLGTPLNLQPLAQGEISLMGNKIVIDTQGNAVFNENVRINKTLFVNDIRPTEENLDVNLAQNQKFNVRGATDAAAFSVNSTGDVTSSGSGSFIELITNNFKIVRGAQADTSTTETLASGSAGVATIVPGEVERTIVSPFVNENSLIYLTPASQTFGTTPYIARQTPQSLPRTKGSFTIRIQKKTAQEVKVNWWIIN